MQSLLDQLDWGPCLEGQGQNGLPLLTLRLPTGVCLDDPTPDTARPG